VGEQRGRQIEKERFRTSEFIPGRSSQCRDPEVKQLAGIAQVVLQSPARTVFNPRSNNMMKFPSTFKDESLLTYQVSDEALETAGGKKIAVNFTLASCTGLSECPA